MGGDAVLKRVFVAPDPGRARLRFAARAVLGIGLAVVVCGLAGHSLPAAVTGGLAALLALFTVADATVRGLTFVMSRQLPSGGFSCRCAGRAGPGEAQVASVGASTPVRGRRS